MGNSVAGKIRIDLLANAANFTAGLRSGAQELGSFGEQVERYNRKFNSAKSATARSSNEQDAWKKSMQADGSFLAGSMKDFGPSGNAGSLRRASMLPWGSSMRSEMTREAAETAATIGKCKGQLSGELAGVAKDLAGKTGMGGIVETAMSFVGANPIAAGAALIGGAAIKHVADREQLVRETIQSSRMLGASTEDASRMHAVGFEDKSLSRLQRSIGEGNNAGIKTLGLDSGKLESQTLQTSLMEVADKFNNLPTAVEKARVAQELFGREAREVIPVLATMKGRMALINEYQIIKPGEAAAVKASDKEGSMASQSWGKAGDAFYGMFGLTGGVSKNFNRGLTMTGDFLTDPFGEGKDSKKHQAQFNKDDEDIFMADIRAKQKERIDKENALAALEAERVQKIMDLTKGAVKNATDAIGELANPGSTARNKFEADLIKGGSMEKPGEHGAAMEAYDNANYKLTRAQEKDKEKNEREAIRSSAIASDPQADYQAKMDKLNLLYSKDKRGSFEYQQSAAGYKKDYESKLGVSDPQREYAQTMANLMKSREDGVPERLIHQAAVSAADKLSAATDNAFLTAFEKFDKDMGDIDAREKDKTYSPEEAKRRREKQTEGILSHVGIKRPEDNFKKDYQELVNLKNSGDITEAEFKKREKSMKREAAAGMTNDVETVSPVAAMAQGSKEAYSAIVAAQLGDPKVQLQQAANAKLDQLIANTKPQARGIPLGF